MMGFSYIKAAHVQIRDAVQRSARYYVTMNGDLEPLGDAATGALVAHVAEGQPSHSAHGEGQGVCLNCGVALRGAYCSACGQAAHLHKSIAAIWHGFVHGILHLDGKLWLTLPLLAFKPGELTRRYIAGERVKFVSPLALFLFSVFLMYAVFSAVGGPFQASDVRSEVAASTDPAVLKADIARQKIRLRALEAQARVTPGDEALAGQIEGLKEAISGMETGAQVINGTVDTGYPKLDQKLNTVLKDPALFLAKLQFNAYKFSWAIILISVPFVWMLFAFRRGFGLYDHAVFVTYSITAMSLLLIMVSLLGAIGGVFASLGQAMLVIAPPVHMFLQLRGAYGLSTRQALWRTILLGAMAFIVLGLFAFLLMSLGLMK